MWVTVDNLSPGYVVGTTVRLNKRDLLLKGTRLSSLDILNAKMLNVEKVDIDSASIKTQLRAELLKTFGKVLQQGRIPVSKITGCTERLLEVLDSIPRIEEESELLLNHSKTTYNHSIGVTKLSIAIALCLGLCANDVIDLTIGAFLHDIGKLFIPNSLLEKKGKLTTEEQIKLSQHTTEGADHLATWELSSVFCDMAVQHHECFDGSGYPFGLLGSDVSLFSRVVHVADVMDALCTTRSYKFSFLPSQALATLNKEKYKYDPVVLDICNYDFNTLITAYR